MYQSSRVNLNPWVGLWVRPLFTSRFVLASAHVIALLSAVRSYPNNYVSSHEKTCHCRAPYIYLVRIRICCGRVTGRSPFASRAHLEATVVQEKHRCFNYYNCIQHCGRHPSLAPILSVVTCSNEDKQTVPDVVGILPETQDFDV